MRVARRSAWKVNELADDAFQREQEELQIFAIEVRANVFISAVQRTGEFGADILTFVDGVIADKLGPGGEGEG